MELFSIRQNTLVFADLPRNAFSCLRLAPWVTIDILPQVGATRRWNVSGQRTAGMAGVVLAEGDPLRHVVASLKELESLERDGALPRAPDDVPIAPFAAESAESDDEEPDALSPAARAFLAKETVGVFQSRLREADGEAWNDSRGLSDEERAVYLGALKHLSAAFAGAPASPSPLARH